MALKLLFILFVIFCLGLFACNPTKKSIKRSENAFEALVEEDSLKAAKRFYKLAMRYPESDYFHKNLFNAGLLYFYLDSLEKADYIFKGMVFEPYLGIPDKEPNDLERDSSRSLYFTRANYQYFSIRMLAEIALIKQDSRKALTYLNLVEKFPYHSDSSLSIRRQELSMDALRFRSYMELGEQDSAILEVLPHALMPSPYHSHPAVDLLILNLKKSNRLIPFKMVLDSALSSYQNHKIYGEFLFKGSYVQLIPLENPNEELMLENIKKGMFYTRLKREINLLSSTEKGGDYTTVKSCNLDSSGK